MTATPSSPTEQQIAVAEVYARALLALARERGQEQVVLEELTDLERELEAEQVLADLLASPLADAAEREHLLERLFRGRLSDLLVDTLQVMNSKGRVGLVAALAAAYRGRFEELQGQIRVRVKTALPLTDAIRRELESSLSELTRKRVLLEESVDESLIGGLVLHIGDRRIDGSVTKDLIHLGHRFLDRASQELHRGGSLIAEEAS